MIDGRLLFTGEQQSAHQQKTFYTLLTSDKGEVAATTP